MFPDIAVTVRLYATLRNHNTNPQLSEPLAVTVPAGAVAADLVGALQLPPEQVHKIFINNAACEWDACLHAGDEVSLFPPVSCSRSGTWRQTDSS